MRTLSLLLAIVAIVIVPVGCAHNRPCTCTCTSAAPVTNVSPPKPAPPFDARSFEEEEALEQAHELARGLANPEEIAREGQALGDIAEMSKRLETILRP